MIRPAIAWFLAAIGAFTLVGLPMPARAQTVDAAVALAADVSRSIDAERFIRHYSFLVSSHRAATLAPQSAESVCA